jgi:hypothetical protein
MSTTLQGASNPAANDGSKDTGQDLSGMIDEFAGFSRSAVQVATRGWKASMDANATLALRTIDSLARSTEAWSKAVRSSSAVQADAAEAAALWKTGAEIAQAWVRDMATNWTEAANVFVRTLDAKDTPA